MYMTKQEFDKIKRKYDTLLIADIADNDVDKALRFVQDLLTAEVAALKEKCPYAIRSINETEIAAVQVFDMRCEIYNGNFGDGD